jgi:hypothetical protein
VSLELRNVNSEVNAKVAIIVDAKWWNVKAIE